MQFSWLYTYFMSIFLFFIFSLFLIFLFIPEHRFVFIKKLAFYFTNFIFLLSLLFLIFFNNEINHFLYILDFPWFDSLNISYIVGIDGISIFFIILTTFLVPVTILVSWNSITYKIKEFVIMLLLLEFLLINVFFVLDLLFFYVFFESILIPMFFIMGVWGARQRRIHATYQFFFFTLLGSVIMLLGIIILLLNSGSTDIQLLSQINLSYNRQIILWLMFFASFAVKIPMFPVHIWLPEAHVEAPTAGSVILAGVLLKLGTYGIIRFIIPIFPNAMLYFVPFIFTFCIIAIIYSSLTTIRQIDLKKIIAYSSVAHMNFALLGFFFNNNQGLEGSLYLMIGHGFISSALFLTIGILYDRYHTRNILYYGGIVQFMPIFSLFFFLFTLGNVGFPSTVNFVGEFLILIGLWKVNVNIAIISAIGIILSIIYAIWLYNRLIFGQFRLNSLKRFSDCSFREFNLLIPFFFLIFLSGIFPNYILQELNISVNNYILYFF